MITDRMRVLLDGQAGMTVVSAYLHAIETQDFAALKRLMRPDVELIHANYPPVRGRVEAADMIRGYLGIVQSVEFDVSMVIGAEGCIVIEKVNIAEGPSGSTARIRVVTILEVGEDGLIDSVRIYADTTDLFRKLDTPRLVDNA